MIIDLEIVDKLEAAELIGEDRADEETLIHTIHDGRQIPRHLLGSQSEEILGRDDIREAYVRERDWGANLVAHHLARELGLGGYLRVNVARVVMDYGRFPGSSGTDAAYLKRYAVFPPFSSVLEEEAKHDILAYYDRISTALTSRVANKKIMLAVHTYDPLNASGTERPEISLVSRLMEYQINSTLPPEVFDPLFPPILCEATSHRQLVYRIVQNLELNGFHAALNYPYVMPVGSIEIRAQVWYFFRHLRHAFEEAFPGTVENPAYTVVWDMLGDVVRRSHKTVLLHGYLHEYREPPMRDRQLFAAARQAYGRIKAFLDENREELVDVYRFSDDYPSCLGMEVRKDLLCDIDPAGHRVDLKPDADETAYKIALQVARALTEFRQSQDR